jgi:glyoxylase-like metal-dependent hydrolase (beta-lactamase superfamily II)
MISLPPTMQVLERGWLSSNNVLFAGRDGTALIDSGYVAHAPQTLALVQHGLRGRALDRLINTHLHSDHCGGNAILQDFYGCQTAIPLSEADKVQRWDVDALSFKATGQQCARFGFDALLAPGDALLLGELEWQALGAAGHDPHSLIFYCPEERILISADALWQNGFGVIFPELGGESGFLEARATLELIGNLDLRLVIPGHGAPFVDVKEALARAFSRLAYLEADPLRNAENAVKVLLKFTLLERQQVALPDVGALLMAIPAVADANLRFLQKTPQELAQWAIGQLLRAGAARAEGDILFNE